jgi:hypothetical protein
MTPAINDPVMVLLLRVLSLVLSSAIILACVRAFIFFGGAIEANKNLGIVVKEAGLRFENFAKEVRDGLLDHEKRIIGTEGTHVDHERRLTDVERRARGPRIRDRDADEHDL